MELHPPARVGRLQIHPAGRSASSNRVLAQCAPPKTSTYPTVWNPRFAACHSAAASTPATRKVGTADRIVCSGMLAQEHVHCTFAGDVVRAFVAERTQVE